MNVTMKLRKDAEVRTDSTATIKFTGLMGQNYVSIDFGSGNAPPLEDNQIVATREQPDLSASSPNSTAWPPAWKTLRKVSPATRSTTSSGRSRIS